MIKNIMIILKIGFFLLIILKIIFTNKLFFYD